MALSPYERGKEYTFILINSDKTRGRIIGRIISIFDNELYLVDAAGDKGVLPRSSILIAVEKDKGGK